MARGLRMKGIFHAESAAAKVVAMRLIIVLAPTSLVYLA